MQEDIKNLLVKFQQGKHTPEDLLQLEEWFDKTSLKNDWTWSPDERKSTGTRLKTKIDKELAKRSKRNSYLRALKIAASVVLISGFIALVYFKRTGAIDYIDPVVYVESNVAAGEKLELLLSDGSSVTLNGKSKIRYPEKFNRATRAVTLLEGEAFFDVKHDSQKPFVVRSGDVVTKVLGTAFNIRSYATLKDVEVTVMRGKVMVNNESKKRNGETEFFLLPGEQASYDKTSYTIKKSKVNVNEVSAWRDGKLIFNNDCLSHVAKVFEYSYGIKITYEKDISAIRFSATFNEKDQLTDMIYAISKANGFTYSIKGKEVHFKKR